MPQPYADLPAAPAARVLVVAEDTAAGDTISRYLKEAGLSVTVAADGPAALAAYGRGRADLVVLDVALPERPGRARPAPTE